MERDYATMLSEREYEARVEYNEEFDKHGKVFMPNNIFSKFSDKEIFVTRKKNRTTGEWEMKNYKTPHVAEAYSYLYLNTWLYRNAKYGAMDGQFTTVGGLKELIGYSADNKTLNYIISKDGILDGLGLTKTLKFKEAPLTYTMEEGFVDFSLYSQYEGTDGIDLNFGSKTFKYPVFALEDVDGEYGYGTFNGGLDGGNIANTTHVDFEVFKKCMTNTNLGCTAFYIYSYLKSRCDMNNGVIEVGLDKITERTGVGRGARDKALKFLKAHGLITCLPASFYIGAGKGDGASVYYVNEANEYTAEEQEFTTRKLFPKEALEDKEEKQKKIEGYWGEQDSNEIFKNN